MTSKMTVRSVLFMALALAVAVPAVFGAELRLKFKEGDLLTYKMVNATNQEQMGMKISNVETRFMEFLVKKVDGDVATVEVKVSRVMMAANNPMTGQMNFDTNEEPTAETANMDFYRLLVNKPYIALIDTRGTVKEVRGFSEIGKTMKESLMKDMAGNPMAEMQAASFDELFSDDAKKKEMELLLIRFPEKSIDSGSAWEDESAMVLPMGMGELGMKMKLTLKSTEDDVASIGYTGTIEMRPKEAKEGETEDPMAAMMRSMKITNGAIEGEVSFDMDEGKLLKRTTKTTWTMEIMGQQMPVSQDQTLELVEPEAEGDSDAVEIEEEIEETGEE